MCGVNTNQHVYLDVGGTDCLTVNFQFGAESATRSYSIKVSKSICCSDGSHWVGLQNSSSSGLQFWNFFGIVFYSKSFHWRHCNTPVLKRWQGHQDVCNISLAQLEQLHLLISPQQPLLSPIQQVKCFVVFGVLSIICFFTISIDVHLSNQNYDICIRRALNKCVTCFLPSILVSVAITATSSSFGLR